MLCWIRVADACVYILFGHSCDLSEQIDIVRAIFALPEAQNGYGQIDRPRMEFSEAADNLDVTKNTRARISDGFKKRYGPIVKWSFSV